MLLKRKKSMNLLMRNNRVTELRALCGQLNWVASQTCPDVAFYVCELTTKFGKVTYDDIQKANKVVKRLKYEQISLKYSFKGDLKEAKLLTFCDTLFANLTYGGSQEGIIVFLGDRNGNVLPLSWSFRRLKRVVKSTLAAETLILVEAAEKSFWLTRIINEILNVDVPIICYTDNHSLFEAAYSNKAAEDKRLRVDIAIVREMVQRKEASVKWIEWKYQLADSLTERGVDSSKLLDTLRYGKL